MTKRRSARAGRLLAAAAALATAVAATEVALYSRNSLSRHPEWINGKRLTVRALMGVNEAAATRNLLARNRLNLHAWHGCNELLLNKIFAPGSVRFSFRADGGRVDFLYNVDAAGFSAFRLSQNPARPGGWARGTPDGEFTAKRDLPGGTLSPGWHRAEVLFSSGTVALSVDGELLQSVPETALALQTIGFRGELGPAFVDDVSVVDAAGAAVVDENFRNDRNYLTVLAALAAASLGLTFLFGRRFGADGSLAALHLGLTGALVLYLAFDYSWWSARYPYEGYLPWRAQPSMTALWAERARGAAFRLLDPLDPGSPKKKARLAKFLGVPAAPQAERYELQIYRDDAFARGLERIRDDESEIGRYVRAEPVRGARVVVLLGTSQTWGAGAFSEAGTLQGSLHRALSKAFPGSRWVVVNASVWASQSGEQVERFRAKLQPFHPELVVANFGVNDASPGGLQKNLEDLLQFDKERRIKTALVLEGTQASLSGKEGRLREAAARFGVPCLDLQAHLAARHAQDAGYIWWDVVHLTSFGQRLAGEFIAGGVAPLLRKGR